MRWIFRIGLLLLMMIASATQVQAGSINFDGLTHGRVVTTQYQASHGVTISVDNPNRGFDFATAFDTTIAPGSTSDPDLLAPWIGGNLPSGTHLGKALIISEQNISGTDSKGEYVSDPDDEGSRPAGSFFIDFVSPIHSFGWDMVDIERVERTGAWFGAFYSGTTLISQIPFAAFDTVAPAGWSTAAGSNLFYDPTIDFGGDNTANRIKPITVAMLSAHTGNLVTSFDRVELRLGGSGAIDNLVYSTPLPTAVWAGLAVLVLLGIARARRRRRSALSA